MHRDRSPLTLAEGIAQQNLEKSVNHGPGNRGEGRVVRSYQAPTLARLIRVWAPFLALRWLFYPQCTSQAHRVSWAAWGHEPGRCWGRDVKPGHSK